MVFQLVEEHLLWVFQTELFQCDASFRTTKDSGRHQKAMHRETLFKVSIKTMRKAAAVCAVLELLMALERRGRTTSAREVYYRLMHFFTDQRQLTQLIRGICRSLNCKRSALGLRVAEKGLVYGNLQIYCKEGFVDCSVCERLISASFTQASTYKSNGATAILVVEKDATFQALIEQTERLESTGMKLLLITGRGFPDYETRFFLKRLIVALGIPAYYVGDYDPHGMLIYITYVFGSRNSVRDDEDAVCPFLRWLGVRYQDVVLVSEKAFIPITAKDIAILTGLLKHPLLQGHSEFLNEVSVMLDRGRKCEIEALQYLSTTELMDSVVVEHISNGRFLLLSDEQSDALQNQ